MSILLILEIFGIIFDVQWSIGNIGSVGLWVILGI